MTDAVHTIIILGELGEVLVRESAQLSQDYQKAVWEALVRDQEPPTPAATPLPYVVSSMIRYYAVGNHRKGMGRPPDDLPGGVVVYRVPPRGWTLGDNGVSFVVHAPGKRCTRVFAVFRDEVDIKTLSTSQSLVVQNNGKAWLATFKEKG